MATETVVVELDVRGDSGQKVLNLKQQLRQATLEAQALAEKLAAYEQYVAARKKAGKELTDDEVDQLEKLKVENIKAAKRAAELKEEISDVNDTINALNPEAKFNAIVNIGQGIASGFAAAQGALALFGTESEEVTKAIQKVQAAMAIAQGLNSINGLRDGFKNLGIVIKASETYTKLAAAAQAAYSYVVGASTGVLKGFRVALAATGIGALIVGLGLLIANWKEVSKWVEKNSDKFKKFGEAILTVFPPLQLIGDAFVWIKDKITELLTELGVLDTAEEDAAEKRVELSEKRSKAISREIEIMKAQGASDEEIAKKEIELAQEKLAAYEQYVAARKKAGRELTDDELDQLETLKVENIKATEALKKIRADDEKKQEEERKKAFEKWRDEQKKKAEEQRKLQEQLTDAKIANIRDEREREIAETNLTWDRKIAAIKGNSQVEKDLRMQLEIGKNNALQALTDKYYKEDLQKTLDAQAKLLEEQKKHAEELKAQKDKDKETQLKIEQDIRDAKLSIQQNTLSSLNSINDLFVRNGQKHNKVAKALAIAQLGVDTARSISSTIAGATAAAAAGGPAAPFLLGSYIASGLATVLTSFVSAKKILGDSSTNVNLGANSGTVAAVSGSAPRVNPTNSPTTNAPTTKEISVNVNANVIETEMTKTQKRITDIQDKSTF